MTINKWTLLMTPRAFLLLPVLLAFLGVVPTAHADSTICPDTLAIQADNAVSEAKQWDAFYDAYKKYHMCDDGAIAEGFSDSAAKLFANHWDGLSEFLAYAAKDNDFKYFAIKHLDETDDANDLDRITSNADKKCPKGREKLCKVISLQAQYPDIADWLWNNSKNKNTDSGEPAGYYPEYDEFIIGDVTEQKGDIAVAFTLEGLRGGTDWLRYIAVFRRSTEDNGKGHDFCCSYQIGGKGIASDEKVEIQHGEIVVSGKAFVEGKDAYCCPSKPMTLRLKVLDERLVEVTKK